MSEGFGHILCINFVLAKLVTSSIGLIMNELISSEPLYTVIVIFNQCIMLN